MNTPTYYLRIYSMSGSTATLLVTFSAANPGFTDGDWLKWSGLNVQLATNTTYAFSFGIKPDNDSGSWAAMAVATNAYAGGEIATIPISGGTITTGSSHSLMRCSVLVCNRRAPISSRTSARPIRLRGQMTSRS